MTLSLTAPSLCPTIQASCTTVQFGLNSKQCGRPKSPHSNWAADEGWVPTWHTISLMHTRLPVTPNNHPTAIVFFDMRAAFYSVLRQSLMHLPQDSTALVHALRRLGVTQQEIFQWLHATDEDNATEGALPAPPTHCA